MAHDAADPLHGTLALALTVGALTNGLASRTTRRRYRRWGFSLRLRFVVAASQLIAAGLLVAPVTERLGSTLALAIIAGVIGAAIPSREAGHRIRARHHRPYRKIFHHQPFFISKKRNYHGL